jgi:hypothetical protein
MAKTAPARRIERGSDLSTRSEIPVSVPSEIERQKQPAEFDVLQHVVKALDDTLCNMADVVDMTDELEDAARKAGGDDADMRAHRQARAYRVLDTIVTAALRQSGTVEQQLADSSPRLPSWRPISPAGRRTTPRPFLPGPTQPRSKAGVFSVCEDSSGA